MSQYKTEAYRSVSLGTQREVDSQEVNLREGEQLEIEVGEHAWGG